jgi:hypothetical protein
MQLAALTQQAIVAHLGCRDASVSHYAYTLGDIPKYDTWKAAANPYDSIVLCEDTWVIGLGITVEVSEDSWPKSTLVFPVSVEVDDDGFTLTSSITSGSHRINRGDDFDANLNEFASAISDGIENTVSIWASGKANAPRVGFATQNA